MDTVTRLLVIFGAMLVSAMMFALPILTALSFAFNWNGLVKILLVIATSGEYILVALGLTDRTDI